MNSTTEIKLGPKDIIFAVIGPTGVGKSTFINVARGRDVTPVGEGTTSCTKQPLPIIFDPIPDCPKLEGYRLILLDTPGFDDTDGQDREISRHIAKWLEASRRRGALIGGVLYMYDITNKRFNDIARQNLLNPSTSAWCNDKGKTVIVTTNWPPNSDERPTPDEELELDQREQELKDEQWKTFQVWRFLGNSTSAWGVINSLLHHVNLSPTLKLPVNGKEIKLGRQDIIFPVMGPSGAGKSTFINIALGKDVTKVGHSTTSCTKHPLPIIVDPIPNCPKLKGYRLVLLDTPGFDDTHEEDVEILKRIAKWLEASRRNGSIVGGVLYLHDISAKRFTGTARQSLRMFSRLCGYHAMPRTVLVTTKWPSDLNVLERREEEMKGEHWNTLIEKGLGVRRFQRNRDSAWEIINHLLEGVPSTLLQVNDIDERLDLQIQAELIKLRMAIPETEAGQELRYTLKELLKMQQEAVALEESFAHTGDREAQRNLENIRATIGKLQDQVKDLRIRLSLPKRFLRTLGIKLGKRH